MNSGNYLIQNKNIIIGDSLFVKGEKAMIANNDIAKNTIIFLFEGPTTAIRTRTSIQVSEDRHIEPGDFGAYANHSCAPNTQVITNYDENTKIAQVLMLSISEIKKGDEVTFDYATTETTVTDNLLNKPCLCKAKNCRKVITGFNELTLKDKMNLIAKDITANYLQISDC